jgi:predicted HD superfamily hydrolase involved in NAD metabolism
MDREQLMESVRNQMPDKRWQHTLGVMETSVILAKRFGADPVKADQAAILHDVAKYWAVDRLEHVILHSPMPEYFRPERILKYDRQLLHAPVGAYVAETEYGITDREVLDAIIYHTSGRESMSLLDKVVCLADYIEPGRNFPEVEHIRQAAETNLNQALIAGFDSTIKFLIERGKTVFPLTILARNSLIEEG